MAREIAAGGIVFKAEPDLRFLMILDGYGRWTFPKGLIEPGESAAEAAAREIEEETGIKGEVVRELDKTHYTYHHPRKGRVSKTVTFYLLRAESDRIEVQSEEIAGAEWVSPAEAARRADYDGYDRLVEKAERVAAEILERRLAVGGTTVGASSRELDVSKVTGAVAELCVEACYDLPEDVVRALEAAHEAEESEVGREIIGICLENARVAREERVPICQDTGVTIVFLELGQDLRLVGGDLATAVAEGVRRGYDRGYLRKSVVADPLFSRTNTGDNTPPVLYVDVVPGDKLRVVVCPKGTGSENMSALRMLTPAAGPEGVKKFIVETVDKAGSNPCPPIIVGVGVGGMMDKAALLAKKALLRPVGRPHPQPEVARLERETLEAVNRLGIGPQGLGGRVTALAVHVETFPTHIGALPVAVNIQCHAARHAERVL